MLFQIMVSDLLFKRHWEMTILFSICYNLERRNVKLSSYTWTMKIDTYSDAGLQASVFEAHRLASGVRINGILRHPIMAPCKDGTCQLTSYSNGDVGKLHMRHVDGGSKNFGRKL